MVVAFFLLGVAVAFWRQLLVLAAIFIAGSLIWNGSLAVWRVFSPEKVFIRNVELVRRGETRFLDFEIVNNHKNRIVRNVRLKCHGSETMLTPVVVYPLRSEYAQSYVIHVGWTDDYRLDYLPIDPSKCRPVYSTVKMEK